MRNVQVSILSILLTLVMFSSFAKADTLPLTYNNGQWGNGTTFTGVISDGSMWPIPNTTTPEFQLFQLANAMFGNAINDIYGSLFTSNNQFFDTYGIKDTNPQWIAQEGATFSVLGRNAGASIDLQVNGTTVYSQGSSSFPSLSDVIAQDGTRMNLGQGLLNLNAVITGDGQTETFSTNASMNTDGFAHFLGFDITELVNFGKSADQRVSSAILFGLEDLLANHGGVDWDYNDTVLMAYNVKQGNYEDFGAAPEPASILLLGLGLAGIPVARRVWKK